MSKVIEANSPIMISEKYNSVDAFNAFVNKMKQMDIPGADKIPVVTDED